MSITDALFLIGAVSWAGFGFLVYRRKTGAAAVVRKIDEAEHLAKELEASHDRLAAGDTRAAYRSSQLIWEIEDAKKEILNLTSKASPPTDAVVARMRRLGMLDE